MINLIGAQLISLPQGVKSAMSTHLPWPNGSIISARMVPGEAAGHAVLMLGGYRLQAKVPANTPMGHVWLQLVSGEMPAQIRLLSDFKAVSMLSEMLANKVKLQEQGGREAAKAGGKPVQELGWQKMDQNQLPFQIEAGVDGQRLMLRDQEDGSPRGMINSSSDEKGFLLHGRADLDNLGPVAFSLEGAEGKPWSLKLYAGRDSNISELRPAFLKWLEEHRNDDSTSSGIEGRLLGGLPQRLAALGDLHG